MADGKIKGNKRETSRSMAADLELLFERLDCARDQIRQLEGEVKALKAI